MACLVLLGMCLRANHPRPSLWGTLVPPCTIFCFLPCVLPRGRKHGCAVLIRLLVSKAPIIWLQKLRAGGRDRKRGPSGHKQTSLQGCITVESDFWDASFPCQLLRKHLSLCPKWRAFCRYQVWYHFLNAIALYPSMHLNITAVHHRKTCLSPWQPAESSMCGYCWCAQGWDF